ncbi:hypothetical protein SARC_00694 [Sphaeroforma arctica JP610]|uniref:Hexosyltransferase n=1 Tax=Sphaeroforma arctica JP610 TaxID=667725 RepID=A0A0L0GE62_9EUKA|nr:hypothetical protein SARC_00694 [Sphaeroforma arctica JP610]KNC87166.1 hypothetical protein SARC_00694 [Sphaeroforma arctica JP610]|eukprot:XP_014161068.1 hypothetical protein SARC_00694 [Sphaeroforma arctica JP610]
MIDMVALRQSPGGIVKATYTFLMLRSSAVLACCLVSTLMIIFVLGSSQRIEIEQSVDIDSLKSWAYSMDFGFLTSGELTQGEQWANRYRELISDNASLIVTNKTNGCDFDKCQQGPYVYFLIPFRNRGESLRRLADTLQIDAESAQITTVDCLCLGVADYDDVVDDSMRSAEALEHWSGSYDIRSVSGPFSRGGGIKSLLTPNNILTTPEDKSIYYIIDTDMVVWPGFIDDVIKNTKLQSGTVPVCWSLDSYNRSTMAGTDGFWRGYGMGMWSIYASTLKRVTHYNIAGANKYNWGLEDYAIQKQLRYGTQNVHRYNTLMQRYCNPYLFHFPHPKIKWEKSANGMGKDVAVNNPFKKADEIEFILSMYEETYFNLNKYSDEHDQCAKFLKLRKNNWKFQTYQR